MTHPEQSWIGRLLTRLFVYQPMDGGADLHVLVPGMGKLRMKSFDRTKVICRSLHRWVITKGKRLTVYLHAWEGDDWSTDFHDHSAAMWSIGLWGSYIEDTPDGKSITYRAPWIRHFADTHRHRVRVPKPICWTLIIHGRKTNDSAFYRRETGQRVSVADYHGLGFAKRNKAC